MSIRHFIFGDNAPSQSRRDFLKKSGTIGGAMAVGFWSLQDSATAAGNVPAAMPSASLSYKASAFITIGADDTITLTMAKVEMGQGAYTVLPMMIAEELEIDLDKIVLQHAPPDATVYGLPFGDQFTGGSLTVRTLWEPMRQTGAAARMVLIQAAANAWKVSPDECFAELGEVVHRSTKRRVKYGKLVTAASNIPLPKIIALKPASEFKLIGKSIKRLDATGKVDGSALFGIDTILPNMVFASVAASPVFGGKLKSVNDTKARSIKGVLDIVTLNDAVAVIAENTWYARQGMAALEIVWDEGENAQLNTADIRQMMVGALKQPGIVARNDGDAVKVLAADTKKVVRTYINPMLAHAPMEAMNCTIHVKADSAEIWVGTQAPARARDGAAKVLGLPPEKVILNNYLLGGGFGRRLEIDYVEQAAAIGKKVGRPVKVIWTREEDIQHDVFRGLYAHSISASLDAKGNPIALYHKFAGPSNLARWAPGWMTKEGVDIDAVDGSINFPYSIPNMRSEFKTLDGPIPTGFWRGVGPTRNILALESFMDELAFKAGQDPLSYRLALLDKHPRAKHVLQRSAKLAGWGEKLPAGTGRGISLLYAWDTYVSQVVDLTVNAAGEIAVKRVVCVVDCGIAVNPDTVVAQMQGGINFGLTAALYSNITIKNGRTEQSNFHDYQMLRMDAAPKIEVEIVQSGEAPGGIGEPSVASLLAAFVNAVHAATHKRLYELPATADLIKRSKVIRSKLRA